MSGHRAVANRTNGRFWRRRAGGRTVNYYPHHIGDYMAATSHLSLLEHGVYRRLMDVCYESERPLPADRDRIYRRIGAVKKAEQRAVDRVLDEFFERTPEGYSNARILREIFKFCEKSNKNSISARSRWMNSADKKSNEINDDADANALRNACERNANQEPKPITNNQEPKINPPTPLSRGASPEPPIPDWMPAEAWQEWCEYRRKKNGKGWTDASKRKSISMLAGLHRDGHDLTAAIDQSIANSWTGLFPARQQSHAPPRPARMSVGERWAAELFGTRRDIDAGERGASATWVDFRRAEDGDDAQRLAYADGGGSMG